MFAWFIIIEPQVYGKRAAELPARSLCRAGGCRKLRPGRLLTARRIALRPFSRTGAKWRLTTQPG